MVIIVARIVISNSANSPCNKQSIICTGDGTGFQVGNYNQVAGSGLHYATDNRISNTGKGEFKCTSNKICISESGFNLMNLKQLFK